MIDEIIPEMTKNLNDNQNNPQIIIGSLHKILSFFNDQLENLTNL